MNKLWRRNPSSPSPSPFPSTTTAGLVIRNPRQTTSTVVSSPSIVDTRQSRLTSSAPTTSVQPRSAVEQYWAARALTAEALLSARLDHHRELQSASYTLDVRRSRDLAALSKIHQAMQAKMEKFVMALLACLLFMVVLVAYLLTVPPRDKHASTATRWRPSLPSHFTIPILSPFTSVIEHDTSVVGTQTIAVSLVVLAALGYAMFRHWGIIQGGMRT